MIRKLIDIIALVALSITAITLILLYAALTFIPSSIFLRDEGYDDIATSIEEYHTIEALLNGWVEI